MCTRNSFECIGSRHTWKRPQGIICQGLELIERRRIHYRVSILLLTHREGERVMDELWILQHGYRNTTSTCIALAKVMYTDNWLMGR